MIIYFWNFNLNHNQYCDRQGNKLYISIFTNISYQVKSTNSNVNDISHCVEIEDVAKDDCVIVEGYKRNFN